MYRSVYSEGRSFALAGGQAVGSVADTPIVVWLWERLQSLLVASAASPSLPSPVPVQVRPGPLGQGLRLHWPLFLSWRTAVSVQGRPDVPGLGRWSPGSLNRVTSYKLMEIDYGEKCRWAVSLDEIVIVLGREVSHPHKIFWLLWSNVFRKFQSRGGGKNLLMEMKGDVIRSTEGKILWLMFKRSFIVFM